MFSHDGKLILKTATENEVEIFLKIMVDYKEHLRLNKRSQISKIIGLFDFIFDGSDKSIKLILMENLFVLNSDAMLRKYDMKGSKHSRKVLKHYNDLPEDKRVDKILKDLDFLELDRDIDVSPEQREEIVKSIGADVDFFTRHQIIDYSIILAVIDKNLVEGLVGHSNLCGMNPHYIEAANDPKTAYLLGIIDYFQLYDFNKAMERFLKRVSKCDPNLDTSSQPPKIYSVRFNTWMFEY